MVLGWGVKGKDAILRLRLECQLESGWAVKNKCCTSQARWKVRNNVRKCRGRIILPLHLYLPERIWWDSIEVALLCI